MKQKLVILRSWLVRNSTEVTTEPKPIKATNASSLIQIEISRRIEVLSPQQATWKPRARKWPNSPFTMPQPVFKVLPVVVYFDFALRGRLREEQ